MQSYIKKINQILWILVAIILSLIAARMINPDILSGRSEWNEFPANSAAILFIVVLLPGALQRLGVTHGIGGVAVRYGIAWRRTLGIAMYLAALAHFLFLIDYLPWFSAGLVKNLDAISASGFAAAVLLLPVILTSNNASIRFFKKQWKIIQRMTYLALPLIAIHLWHNDHIVLCVFYALATIVIVASYIIRARKQENSMAHAVLIALSIIAIGGIVTYVTLRGLFKNAEDAARDTTIRQHTSRIEELVGENITLKKTIRENAEKVAEFDRIQAEKKAQEAAAAEAARKAAQEAARLDYTNGTYTASSSYVTDKGEVSEGIDVTMTIGDDVVQSVRVAGRLSKKKSKKYFGQFENAIGGVVVGRDVDTLNVVAVGGASDSSAGFRAALTKIKSQARQ